MATDVERLFQAALDEGNQTTALQAVYEAGYQAGLLAGEELLAPKNTPVMATAGTASDGRIGG